MGPIWSYMVLYGPIIWSHGDHGFTKKNISVPVLDLWLAYMRGSCGPGEGCEGDVKGMLI